MLIAQRMVKNPITITPDVSIQIAADLMKKEKIHYLPVLDNKKRLVGLLTERDILLATPSPVSTLSTYEIGYLVEEIKVKDVMDKDPITIKLDTTVVEAARLMSEKDTTCLLVMDGKALVGLVTKTNMFNLLLEMFGARQYGVTCEVLVTDKPGVMTKLLKSIANQNLDLISNAVTSGRDSSTATITLKVRNSSVKQVEEILKPQVLEVLSIYEG